LVDDDDFEKLNGIKWYLNQYGYVVNRNRLMHRIICNLKTGDNLFVDHKDGDRLNNCKSNLRICTHSQNAHNRKINKNNTSGYKGVSWNKKRKRWGVRIKSNGVIYQGKTCKDVIEAANEYNRLAILHHGEFALLNNVEPYIYTKPIKEPNNLKQLRIDAGLTQRQVAEACKISQPQLADYENGKHRPSMERYQMIVETINKIKEL